MEIRLKNIACIKDSTIKIGGLTVLTGENNTGKSILGKVLYGIQAGVFQQKHAYISHKETVMTILCKELVVFIRDCSSYDRRRSVRKIFSPKHYFDELMSMIDEQDAKVFEGWKDNIYDNAAKFLERKNDLDIVRVKLDSMIHALKIAPNRRDELVGCVGRNLSNNLQGNIKHDRKKEARIVVSDEQGEIINISASENSHIVDSVSLREDYVFNAVSVVESPVYLQLSLSDTLIPYQEQLMTMLVDGKYYKCPEESVCGDHDIWLDKQIKNITSIIGGTISSCPKGFVFIKNMNVDGKRGFKDIPSTACSLGVLTFGMIQLLLKGHGIVKNGVVFIDTPEAHLHPKQQVEYAKVIAELIKYGVNVILTTNSPYMLKALVEYTKECPSNYYFATRGEGGCNMENITYNLNKAFVSFAEPLQDLVW